VAAQKKEDGNVCRLLGRVTEISSGKARVPRRQLRARAAGPLRLPRDDVAERRATPVIVRAAGDGRLVERGERPGDRISIAPSNPSASRLASHPAKGRCRRLERPII